MKKIILLVSLFISVNSLINAQSWMMQAVGYDTASSYPFDIHICDANVAWTVAFRGDGKNISTQEFSMTSNAGTLWTSGVVTTDTNFRFSCIWGADATTAYTLMYNSTDEVSGGLWKTTDGGGTWNPNGVGQIFTKDCFPNVVYFWSPTNGMIMGDPTPGISGNGNYFEIYLTSDAGTTWTRVPQANIPAPLANEYGLTNDYTVLGNTIWFGTNKGRVFKSIDNGLNWTAVSVPLSAANQITSLAFRDANNGICLSSPITTGTASLYKTTNGGSAWTKVTPTGQIYYSDFANIPNTNIYVSCGASGTGGKTRGSSYSQNDGASWTLIDSAGMPGVTQGYTTLAFLDMNTGYAGGFSVDKITDGIYKWDAGTLKVNDVTPKAEISAYPNPSSGIVYLNLKPKNSDVVIRLVDAMGRIAYEKAYANTGGTFNKSFDFSNLAAGVYTITVNSGNEQIQNKLIIQ